MVAPITITLAYPAGSTSQKYSESLICKGKKETVNCQKQNKTLRGRDNYVFPHSEFIKKCGMYVTDSRNKILKDQQSCLKQTLGNYPLMVTLEVGYLHWGTKWADC